MEVLYQTYMSEQAIDVIRSASSIHGIKASSEKKDNYNSVWARDVSVTGLAIIAQQIKELYAPLRNSLMQLQKGASAYGQIPSNIRVDESGDITSISFGGPVGRVDASFWWIVASVLYLKQEEDEEFAAIVHKQCDAIFKLAECWEFNGKGLMCVPMSSNWADEYVTNGYVLYDQLVRYWALLVAADLFNRNDWGQKALEVKIAIKQHFLLEAELNNSLYTKAQQETLRGFDIEESFIASFSPGDRVERFDGWSIALLLLLDIPSKASVQKINRAVLNILGQNSNNGVPAFWPLINADDELYKALKLNHSYNFKNLPGHFHNGGIWPVVNGFLIAGLKAAGMHDTAYLLMDILHKRLDDNFLETPFAEYFDYYEGKPHGVNNLCFSASGYLLASLAVSNYEQFSGKLFSYLQNELALLKTMRPAADAIIELFDIGSKTPVAISIAGESGSGKTTLSKLFGQILRERGLKVLLLHQDDYFILPPKKNHEARLNDFSLVGSGEVRLKLLDKHINKIKSGTINTLTIPHMDWITDTEQSKIVDVAGIEVVLVDGTYTSLLKEVDYRVFINTNYQQTRKNRVNRNRETVTPFIENVLKKESNIIQQHFVLADIVIDNQLNIVNSSLKKQF
ncbi:MAG: glycoside hydrolase 100 family protein [Mucilaginibacter sp.]